MAHFNLLCDNGQPNLQNATANKSVYVMNMILHNSRQLYKKL